MRKCNTLNIAICFKNLEIPLSVFAIFVVFYFKLCAIKTWKVATVLSNAKPAFKLLKRIIVLFILIQGIIVSSFAQNTQTITTSGNFTIPAGVTSIKVECWGGGGAGGEANINTNGKGGGGGGAYASSILPVTSGNIYAVTVGAGGIAPNQTTASTAGGQSSFATLVIALGGSFGANNNDVTSANGGAGGLASGSTGTIKYNGGTGGNGNTATNGGGGGGGSSATASGNGVNGVTSTTTTGGAGGSSSNGVGGNGGNNGNPGLTGTAPGGGGGGRGDTGNASGNGGKGQVIVSWITVSATSTVTCVGGSTGTITATASGGTTYTYSIDGTNYQSSSIFGSLATGTYTIYAKEANGCIASTSITVNSPSVCTDPQTPGVGSWIGYVYGGHDTNFANNTYYGHYTEAETFNQSFGVGGDNYCFGITSNSNAISINTVNFSVRYLMTSSKKGLYAVDLGSDDGNRLTVDGALIFNEWNDHAISSHPSVLMSLNGASSLIYDFYENAGLNQVYFQNLTLVLANNLTTNTTQTIAVGNSGTAIGGDVFGTLPTGITLSGTGYQWVYSTTPGGATTNISGATDATFTPNTATAPFNTPGTYYVYRNAILSSGNNVSPNPYFATNTSNAATIITGPVLSTSETTLTGFSYILSKGPSVQQTFTVTGINLTTNVTVTPPTDYEISTTSGSGFQSTAITLTQSGGTVASTTIYVRLKAGLAVGNYNSETIALSSTGATTQNVTCSGSVVASLPFWYKADGAIAYNGTTWSDESSNGNNAVRSAGTISLANNSINFNPSLTFTSVDRQMQIATTTTVQSLVVVAMPSTMTHLSGLIGATSDDGIRLGSTTSPYDWAGDANVNDWANGGSSRINGVSGNQFTKWHIINQTRSSALNSRYYLGGYYSARPYTGSIAEIMAFVGAVPEQDRVESYLAIKYGITLGHDYKEGPVGGATIYTISGYATDIAGLGNDATYGLNQKVSSNINTPLATSSRIVIATTNDFTSSNLSGTRTSLNYGQYLIWGHNNAATNAWVTSGIYSVVNRIWKIQNTDNVGIVSFQIDLTGYPAATSGTYTLLVDNDGVFSNGGTSEYTLVNSSGSLYTATITFPNGTSYFTISGYKPSTYWVGGTDSNWKNSANWSGSYVPASRANVEFANGTNYSPAAQRELDLDQDRTIGNLVNTSNQPLVIPPGLSLTVNGTISSTNDNNIYIQSSTTANGSLICPGALNVHATVEMYSKANKGTPASYLDPKTGNTITYSYNWQYFGIPINTVTASPTLDGSYVRRWDESGTTISNHWVSIDNSYVLQLGIGYEITQDNPTTIYFHGQLVNSDITVTSSRLTYTSTGLYSGQNILANPFTAALDFSKIVFGTDIQQAVWLYSTGSIGNWAGGSQYQSVTTISGLGLPTQIPSMQGMLVQFKSGITASSSNSWVKFPYSAVVKNVEPQRVKGISNSSSSDVVALRIDVKSSHSSDKMWLFSRQSFTRKYDNGYDGLKMFGSILSPQLYAIESDGNYQIDCIDDLNNTLIGFQVGQDTDYTLTFTHQNTAIKYAGIYLVDLVENKTIDITADSTTYTFNATSADVTTQRFKITTQPCHDNDPDATSRIKIFSSGNDVFIQNLDDSTGDIKIFDITGRYLRNASIVPNGITKISGLHPGAYVAKAKTNTEQVSKKLIVGN